MLTSFLTVAVAVQAIASPQPRPDAAVELAKNMLPITEQGDRYSGAGWDKLIADGANSQFFMIGEQHGTADIAIFGSAVNRALSAHGYTHAAYEVGPYSTDYAEKLIRSGTSNLAGYIRKSGHDFVFPFFFFQEEVDLAGQIVAASPDKSDALWGLDQEFAGAAPLIVELLRDYSATPSEAAAVDAFTTKAAANNQLIATGSWSDFSDLEKAFVGNNRGRELVSALKLSNEIYAPFTGRGGSSYAGNLRRETYMKANFAARFAEAERRNGSAPKVFLKFGGYHAQKGFTGTNVPGLGNFLYEWGVPRGFGFTNVMVDCIGGEVLNPLTKEAAPCQPYFPPDTVIGRMTKPNRLTLIDLRPLRPMLQRITGLDEESRKLILSFDYYLAIKNVTAATPTVRRPASNP